MTFEQRCACNVSNAGITVRTADQTLLGVCGGVKHYWRSSVLISSSCTNDSPGRCSVHPLAKIQASLLQTRNSQLVDYFLDLLGRYSRSHRTDCARSSSLKSVPGPLGLLLENYDPDTFTQQSIKKRIADILEQIGADKSSLALV